MRILSNEEREYKVNDICVILLYVKIRPGQNHTGKAARAEA